jgi:hypothetical protein
MLSSALLVLLTTLAAAPATPTTPPAPPAAGPGFAGHWDGAIIRTLGRDEIDFTLDLEPPRQEVGWTGKMSVLLTGVKDRPLDKVAVDGSTITFEDVAENGRRTFKGKLSDDGSRIVGDYTRGDTSFPFELERRTSYRTPSESELIDLSPDFKELKQLFDQDKDKVRMVLLLSPT